MERRYFEIEEVRAEETNGQRQITGLIPYDSKSVDLGGFVEEIKQGAFARSLRDADQVALWSHDTSRPLGRRSRGTLALEDTNKGLRITITPPDTSWGRDAYESVRRGDVGNMSFGFNVPDGGDSWREWGGKIIRSLLDVDLLEVSPVVFGAYPRSQTAARSQDGIYGDIPDIPAELRQEPGDADTTDEAQARRSEREQEIRTLEIYP